MSSVVNASVARDVGVELKPHYSGGQALEWRFNHGYHATVEASPADVGPILELAADLVRIATELAGPVPR